MQKGLVRVIFFTRTRAPGWLNTVQSISVSHIYGMCLAKSSGDSVRAISPAVHCSAGPTRNPLPETLLPLTRPSTSAWLSDERGNVGRTRQGGSCGRARARTCARGRAGRSRRPPCGGDTCHGGDPNLCSTSAAACCADACNGHFRRTDACRPAGPGPPTGTPGSSTCSINLCSTRATPDPPRWPAWPSAPTS